MGVRISHSAGALLARFRFGLVLVAFALWGGELASAAPETTPAAGLRPGELEVHALTGARIVVAPGQVIERGTLVIRSGVIEAVGADVAPPPDARVWPLDGRTIYPGLIDGFTTMDAALGDGASRDGYWNKNVTPQLAVAPLYRPDGGLNRQLRSQGVVARLVAPSGGNIRGTSALVSTADGEASAAILRETVFLHVSLQPGGRDGYPTSPMGAMALVRQSLLDADWYTRAWTAHSQQPGLPRPETSEALSRLAELRQANVPLFIETPDERYFLRADALAREFNLPVVVRGSHREYRRLEAIRATGRAVILPLALPDKPAVESPEGALDIPLENLLHFDLAPENAARLDAAGVKFAFSSQGLPDRGQYLAQLRTLVERGLAAESALRAATIAAAELCGVEKSLGTLEAGKIASLVITDGNLFEAKTKILETWVDGQRYETGPSPILDVRGTWELAVSMGDAAPLQFTVTLEGELASPGGKVKHADKEVGLSHVFAEDGRLTLNFNGDPFERRGSVRLSGTVTVENGAASWLGSVVWPDGTMASASAKRSAPLPAATPSEPPKRRTALYAVNYPLSAFGRAGLPEQPAAVAFTHATIWSCGPAGIIEDGTLVIEQGKITAVGKEVPIPAGAIVVNCQGRHIAPGILDCHSHIATDGGVNEGGQTITAEARIGDFINPDDVNIYRQLAGGVTAINVLHGSANTIGGQTQLLKLRWGALGEEMKLDTAPPGIKFALGENPKRSNSGDESRYPQTRMGVEQLVIDAFQATAAYRQRHERYKAEPKGLPPRTDLELEALSQVLSGERLIHCHSYRQDEILAFLRTCAAFNVRVATLQHVLEGYKLADVMSTLDVGGSSFSDWWAYKFEVYDAIPHNAALMHHAGVLVSINSDFPELARRLNTEAAKCVKYGGVPPEEALKFVTLNPAKQLRIDNRVGSLEVGKDADLAVWNGSPLSSLARCEQTWVDGRRYFDREEDQDMRREAQRRRTALIQRILRGDEAPPPPGE